jgi:MinD superfamily P-loop ATPase
MPLFHHTCGATHKRAAVTAEYTRKRDGYIRIQCQGCGQEQYISPEKAVELEGKEV